MHWLPLQHQLLRGGRAAQAQNFLPSWPPSFCLEPSAGREWGEVGWGSRGRAQVRCGLSQGQDCALAPPSLSRPRPP